MRQRTRAVLSNRRPGYILLVSYLLTTMLSLWTFTAFQRSMAELRAADRHVINNQAFQLAEAAVDRAMQWMKQQPTPPGGVNAFDPFNGRVCLEAQCQAWYQVTIDPDDNNPTSYSDVYTITAVGQVERIQTTRRIGAVISSQNFAQYAYFTNFERLSNGTRVWFVSQDWLEGPVHSNDQFNIAGNPTFDGPVTSAADSINYRRGPPQDDPQFNGGLELNSAQITLPATVTPLRLAAASSSGLWLEGNSTIQFQEDGTMLVTNAARGWTNAPMPTPANGAIFVNRGNVLVSGTLNGQLTVGSSDDIVVTDNIYYADDPRDNPDSDDILGLVAEENVVVSQAAPNNVDIHACIMALDESFVVENWWQGSPKGDLSVLGGIVQYRRGPVGSFSGNATKVSGYSKHYVYDQRLMRMAPPYYPTTNQYETTLWKEE